MDNFEIRSYILNLININPKLIKTKLNYEYKFLRHRKEYFELKKYIDNFLEELNQEKFFIISGLRGVGKTTIIYQLYNYLIDECNFESRQILFLDLERLKDEPNLDLMNFFDVFINEINEDYRFTNKPLFIFVDETQYSTKWASPAKVVYDENVNVFTIFTGSNALNFELNSDYTRRSIKKELYPLNFSEYLDIKYDLNISSKNNGNISELLLDKNIDNLIKMENELQIYISQNLETNIKLEFEEFLQYGNLPFGLHKEHINLLKETFEIRERTINNDMLLIDSFNSDTLSSALILVNLLAKQKPSEISLNSLSNILEIDKNTIKNLLDALEKTQLIFSFNAYGSEFNQSKKAKEYYFLATQIKAAHFLIKGDVSSNYRQYLGILLENQIASILYKMKSELFDGIGIYYDSRKGGVDFIIKDINEKAIPVEVGIGKKNKKQIIKAIEKYNSDWGIVISDKTTRIIKEDNILYIPFITFCLIG